MNKVAINPNEVNLLVDVLRNAACDKNRKRTVRWRCAMLANALVRRAYDA
jgi:hypothetical protein